MLILKRWIENDLFHIMYSLFGVIGTIERTTKKECEDELSYIYQQTLER